MPYVINTETLQTVWLPTNMKCVALINSYYKMGFYNVDRIPEDDYNDDQEPPF